jgi:RHH-type proline utilization regulon transcriptional repressor/proline dehydrogenase/delta 1-pyrroline-5-carboxylate dehydrogenase
MAAVNATGYGLTFGLHTRIDETIERVVAQAGAGNIYVNRNVIGAVVGVQPFGGHGLSGTGPKAGGPLYLRRLLRRAPPVDIHPGRDAELPGPVGERNLYRVEPRGTVLCLAGDPESRRAQVQAAEGTGNHPVTLAAETGHPDAVLFAGSPSALQAVCAEMAAKEGPIVPVFIAEDGHYRRDNLVRERVISINTTAAGGNASLMTIG